MHQAFTQELKQWLRGSLVGSRAKNAHVEMEFRGIVCFLGRNPVICIKLRQNNNNVDRIASKPQTAYTTVDDVGMKMIFLAY